MLAAIRRFSKSWVALGLIGLLVLSFAVWGMNDVFRAQGSRPVIKAGAAEMSGPEFKQRFDQWLKEASRQEGRTVGMQEIVDAGYLPLLLEGFASDLAMQQWAGRVRLTASDKLVIEQIRQIPAFFDPVTGRFDRESFLRALAGEGITEKAFEADLRQGIMQQHFNSALMFGARAPRTYGAVFSLYGLETRDAEWFVVGLDAIQRPPAPTDEQLQQLLRQEADRLRQPERRRISLALFVPSELERQVVIDEEELRREYAFRAPAASEPELRSFVQIPVRDAQTGTRVVQALRAGRSAEEVARAEKIEPVAFDNQPRSAIPDAKVAETAFAMQAGQVSDVIQGDLGRSVVVVRAVRPGRTPTFAEMRPQLEQSARRTGATELMHTQMDAFQKALDGGATFQEAARKSGAMMQPFDVPLSRQQMESFGFWPELVEAAFTAPKGLPTETLSGPKETGASFTLMVEEILPPRTPTLEEVRAPLTQFWMQQEIARRLRDRADELAERVRKGEPLATVARAAGIAPRSASGMERPTRERDQGQAPPAVRLAAFGAKPGEVFAAEDGQGGFVVGRTTRVVPPSPEAAAVQVDPRRQALTMGVLEDLNRAAREAAKTQVKARTFEDRARTALGLEPQAPADATTTPAPAKK